MHRSTLLLLTILIFLISACSDKRKQVNSTPALFQVPKSYPLNIKEGYLLNVLNHDTIKPLINSNGDTIRTGKPLPFIGKKIDPDKRSKPILVPSGKPKQIQANINRIATAEDPVKFPIDISKLQKTKLGEGDSLSVTKNSAGKIIPTGVSISVEGVQVPSYHPKPVHALTPRMKDAALYNIQYVDVEQGMYSSSVMCILSDKNKNLWFGTWGGGVSRYTGKDFTHYTEKEGLSNNMIRCMLEDHSGNIWFGTHKGGITRYDGNTFTHFTEDEGLLFGDVYSIIEQKNGMLWFGTSSGATKFDGSTFTHFTVKEGLCHNDVRSIIEDAEGNLWFGTDGGVSRFDGKYFTHITEKDGLSKNNVRCILEDHIGKIWFGTQGGGLTCFDGRQLLHFTEHDGLSNNNIRCLLEDNEGYVWIGTDGKGICRFDGLEFMHITETEGLSSNRVMGLAKDQSGNIWVGTLGGGTSFIGRNRFQHLTNIEALSDNEVRSFLEAKNGDLWLGTSGKGAFRFDGHHYMNYTTSEGLTGNTISSILEDNKGHIWFGTHEGGVSQFDGTRFINYTQAAGLTHNIVLCIEEDRAGNLWFGTSAGITRFDGSNFIHYTEKEGLSHRSVRKIKEDKNGNLWFATAGGGVSKYDGQTITHYTEREGMTNNTVTSIVEDKNGNLWFGTEGGGITRFDGTAFIHYTENEGLSYNITWSITEDHAGNLWVATEKGLSYLMVNDSLTGAGSKGDRIITLENQDGLKAIDFGPNSSLLDQHNQIWWGSGKSLVKLDLNTFSVPTDTPEVFLRQLDINGVYADYHLPSDQFEKDITFSGAMPFENYPLNLELPYYKNHLTFHFNAMDWAAPHKLKYTYQLEGLHSDWSEITEDTKTEFRSLKHGTYTFNVKAIGIAQHWSKPYSFTFTIHPPWWHTQWAYALYLLLLIASAIWVERYTRQQLLKKERDRNREKELIQAKEIEVAYRDLKSTQKQLIQSEKMASLGELTAGIAHEIQNPLNFVNNFSEVNKELLLEMKDELAKGNMNEVNTIANDIIDNEEKIIHHGQRADGIVKSMLLHSRTSSGIKEPTNINALCDEYLRLAYHGLRAKDKTFNATMKTDFDSNIGLINVVPQDFGRVILNLISNAFYAVSPGALSPSLLLLGAKPHEPTVTVTTIRKPPSGGLGAGPEPRVEIRVKDNGPGIPDSIKDKIFQPFFTTKPTGQGTGLGLSLSYDIIKAHGGEIKLETKEGEGSTFIIILPIA
jgi:ligand-binding sensor domain-containing protein/signal transduction histidine kinase